MNVNTQIPEIGAEMLLNLLYPELEEKWIAHHDGTFYRNYNQDVLSLSLEEGRVWLSRDSLLGLLPQGVLSGEEDLKKGDWSEKHKELERRIKILSEAFLPIDTFAFRRLLKAEKGVEDLLGDKLSYILKNYFGYDLEAEQNPYVREFAVLLPCIRERRGDFALIRSLLASVFNCEVIMSERRYSQSDSSRQWLPELRYELIIPGLTAGEFRDLNRDIQPLRDFLSEWFMPVEVHLELLVKQPRAARTSSIEGVLDYNTEL